MRTTPRGGEHTTKRKAVLIPTEWWNVVAGLAGKKRQPVTWFILSLLADAADSNKIERPQLPWEREID